MNMWFCSAKDFQNKGVGTKLTQSNEKYASDRGIESIILNSGF